ncbi:predicted protein [Nematostella vectensis]|uniref:Endothelin-converting enzyme 1 n=1 Tax=Nematostella vectensis TaxID=45351 RepID=A7REV1_NEMVE|nr:predicted protein [Nematostella vectensis]|eukprot:XP_001641913.1 predicted protein [Nematostella vectensis]
MLIFCVVLLCLYLHEKQRNEEANDKEAVLSANRTKVSSKSKTSKLWSQICWSPSCIQTSADLLRSIDPNVNPCDDFYGYACGGWIKKNIRPAKNPKWDQFSKLTEENNALMNKLINSRQIRALYGKALHFYDSCMDKAEIERLGGEPLTKLIKEFGSWAVIDKSWNETNWDFMTSFITAHRELAVSPLVSVWVDFDIKNSSVNVINLDQSYPGISHRAFTRNSSTYRKMRHAYKELMVNLTMTLGGDSHSLREMEDIYKFEKKLANILEPYVEGNKKYRKMSIRKLQNATGPQIDWMRFLTGVFRGVDYKIMEEEEVVVYAYDYLVKLAKILEKTPKKTLANYIMWRVVKIQYVQLSKEYRKIFKNFYIRAFNFWRESPREEVCLSALSENFGMPLSKMYLDRRFKGKSKKLATEIVENIRDVFIARLKDITWMDNVTKHVAEEKAEYLLENIGYPDYVMDSKHLASLYKEVPVDPKTYFLNQVYVRRNDNLRNYAKLGKPFDKTEWPFPPTMLNAYYSYNENKMVFPAAMLQAPFYYASYPRAVNYGGIGTIMAHELTHGFDVTGKDYNKYGNNIKWWTDKTIQNFYNKSQCLVEQYGNFTFHGGLVDGKLTLSENIADNGGVKQAFEAYQSWVSRHGPEPRLPGMMLTNEQIFFFAFARNWCGMFSPEAGKLSLKWDEHAPMPWRVNGSLKNFKKFAEHFKCPVGSPMNPEKRCAVW